MAGAEARAVSGRRASARVLAGAVAVVLMLYATIGAAQQECLAQYSTAAPHPPGVVCGRVWGACQAGCQPRDKMGSYTAAKCVLMSDMALQNKVGHLQSTFDFGACGSVQNPAAAVRSKGLSGEAMANFSPCDLVPYLRGRTLWLMGDSHSKRMYWALQCFLFDFWDQRECEVSPNAAETDLLRSRLFVKDRPLTCFHLRGPGGGRVCLVHMSLSSSIFHEGAPGTNASDPIASTTNSTDPSDPIAIMPGVDRTGGLLPLLQSRFSSSSHDIFVLNVGFHDAKSPRNRRLYEPNLEELGRYLQATKDQWPHVLWRETPAYHITSDERAESCQPLQGLTYESSANALRVDQNATFDEDFLWRSGISTNKLANEIMSRYGVPIIPGFNISVGIRHLHINRHNADRRLDCVHFCQPGLYQFFTYYLYDLARRGETGIAPLPVTPETDAQFECVEQTPSYEE